MDLVCTQAVADGAGAIRDDDDAAIAVTFFVELFAIRCRRCDLAFAEAKICRVVAVAILCCDGTWHSL